MLEEKFQIFLNEGDEIYWRGPDFGVLLGLRLAASPYNAYSGVEGVGTLHLYLDIGDKIYDYDFLVPQVVRLDTGSAYDILMENNGVATLSSHYPGQ